MKKPSPTQRKILETAAGIAAYQPRGRSEHGGWSGAYVACRRNGWTGREGEITVGGLAAIGRAAYILLTVADHERNGFISLAATGLMFDDEARSLIAKFDAMVEAEAEPGDDASFAFILDLMLPNGDQIDTGKRMLPLQVAALIAPEAVAAWLVERPDPNAVIKRRPLLLAVDHLRTCVSGAV